MLKLKMSNAKETNVAELKKHLEAYKGQLKAAETNNNIFQKDPSNKIRAEIKKIEKRIQEYDDPAPGAPKGGKTRKHRKGSKKTAKRRHRK